MFPLLLTVLHGIIVPHHHTHEGMVVSGGTFQGLGLFFFFCFREGGGGFRAWGTGGARVMWVVVKIMIPLWVP